MGDLSDLIMTIEGLDDVDGTLSQASPMLAAKVTREQQEVATRARLVTGLETEIRSITRKLKELDDIIKQTGNSRGGVASRATLAGKRLMLKDQLLRLGKKYEAMRRLHIFAQQRVAQIQAAARARDKATAQKHVRNFGRLVNAEAPLRRVVKQTQMRTASISTIVPLARTMMLARKRFVAVAKDNPILARKEHEKLKVVHRRAQEQHKELNERLKKLATLPDSVGRQQAVADAQDALRLVRRVVVGADKGIKKQRSFGRDRMLVLEPERKSREIISTLSGCSSCNTSGAGMEDYSGFEEIEVDASGFSGVGGFLKDLKSAGESVLDTKKKIDGYSKAIDDLTGGSKKNVKQTAQQTAKKANLLFDKLKLAYKTLKGNRIAENAYAAVKAWNEGNLKGATSISTVKHDTELGSKTTDPWPGKKNYWPTARANLKAFKAVLGDQWKDLQNLILEMQGDAKYQAADATQKEERKANNAKPANKQGAAMKNASTDDDKKKICFDILAQGTWDSVTPMVRKECISVGVAKEEGDTVTTSSGMSTGAKIGIAAAAVAILGGAAFVIIKKKRAGRLGDSYAHDIYEND